MLSPKAKTMNSYSGPADLLREPGGDRIPVVVHFSVSQRSGGLRSWEGTISSPSGEPLFLEPGRFTLRLPDGREGVAMVNRVSLSVGARGLSEAISFLGSGPSPLDE